MAQYKADVDIYTSNDSGPRNTGSLAWIIFHTTENSGNTTAQDVARYQQNPSAGGSYNVLVDKFGTSVRSNDDNYIPWAAGSVQANGRGLHISVVGQASTSREVWLRDYDKALRKAGEVVAKWSKDYGIPLARLNATQLKAGSKGIAGHNECSQAFGGSDHWDPGTGFPYDFVINYARGGATTPPPAGGGMNLEQNINAQLTGSTEVGKYPGWAQLGNRTVVDALAAIGAALKIPGFKDPKAGQ
ncbi:N-acetylmuramoyl-L-alanine amidase [Rhodococcus hoagii]|nr:N-acetylmuramoyl-L-alanine amidase [Prescottella equi]